MPRYVNVKLDASFLVRTNILTIVRTPMTNQARFSPENFPGKPFSRNPSTDSDITRVDSTWSHDSASLCQRRQHNSEFNTDSFGLQGRADLSCMHMRGDAVIMMYFGHNNDAVVLKIFQ